MCVGCQNWYKGDSIPGPKSSPAINKVEIYVRNFQYQPPGEVTILLQYYIAGPLDKVVEENI